MSKIVVEDLTQPPKQEDVIALLAEQVVYYAQELCYRNKVDIYGLFQVLCHSAESLQQALRLLDREAADKLDDIKQLAVDTVEEYFKKIEDHEPYLKELRKVYDERIKSEINQEKDDEKK